MAPFCIEPLGPLHDRSGFDSGSVALDRYLREQVGQDIRRRITTCWIARCAQTQAVAGYYTLAAGSVALTDLPAATAKRLPRYPSVPMAHLGRLAVARSFQGRQLGAALLWDAVMRTRQSPLAAFALVVDAKDDAAAAFYRHHDFVAFEDMPRRLFLPLGSAVVGFEVAP